MLKNMLPSKRHLVLEKLSAILLFVFISLALQGQINPSSIVSVEFKTGAQDQGIDLFPDLMFGVAPKTVVDELLKMQVNTIRVPVSKPMTAEKNAVLITFVKNLYDNGGEHLAILLSQRKWNLIKVSQQEDWAKDISIAFNALDSAGYGAMVKGCIFDENAALNGDQSSEQLWNERHQGVLGAMDLLNAATNNAFKSRTVFIHGKGYGSQFLGVKASSNVLNFPAEIALRCANYAYNFKYFQVGSPSDKSLTGWQSHYVDYCKLSEVKDLGVELVFVGDSGDGLRANSFTDGKNPYGGPGQYVIKALRDVFVYYGWAGFSIGPFIREGLSQDLGATVLFAANDGILTERTAQTQEWWTWYETTRTTNASINAPLQPAPLSFYPNPVVGNTIYIKNSDGVLPQGQLIRFYDLSGKQVLVTSFATTEDGSVNISSLGKGVYIVRYQSQGKAYFNKIIVD